MNLTKLINDCVSIHMGLSGVRFFFPWVRTSPIAWDNGGMIFTTFALSHMGVTFGSWKCYIPVTSAY